MRFPLSLTTSMTRHILSQNLRGVKKYPLVLMLEPLFKCNLHCAGCGRIREYANHLTQMLSVEECLDSMNECGAPVVSICGGEPLIYPEIGELVQKTVFEQKRHVYLCTNGLLLKKHIEEGTFKPTSRFFINIHLDGMEKNHDASTCRSGVWAAAIDGLKAAVAAGFQVCTNTTLYRESSVDEIVELCSLLESLGVCSMLLAPAYSYEMFDESSKDAMFLKKEETQAKFRELERHLKGKRLGTTPLYLDFLTGRRELPCAAWANPTRNVCGWKGPCYLLTDAHYATYRELIEKTDWNSLGPTGTDSRCANCMMHCGFEPGAVLVSTKNPIQGLRTLLWQLGIF
ncbi:MAG: adenosyl-hopene transferase HpnH [Thermoguttaceae bacterium]|nr:adenosyl-hopene transferase HpnH [Thermoguttaceae bacterium]